jgi:hypothetical protein
LPNCGPVPHSERPQLSCMRHFFASYII